MREIWMHGGRRWNMAAFLRTSGVTIGACWFRQAGWRVIQVNLAVLVVQFSWTS